MSDIRDVPAEIVESQQTPAPPQTEQTTTEPQQDDDGFYICDERGCDRTFPTLQGVTMHKIRAHSGRGWDTSRNLAGTPTHGGRIPQRTPCSLCGKPITAARMQSHLRRVHNATTPRKSSGRTHGVECPMCANIYSSDGALRSHLYRAHGTNRTELANKSASKPAIASAASALPSDVTRGQIDDETWQQRAATVQRASAEFVRLTAERADYKLNLDQFTVDDDVVILRDASGGMWMLRRIG